MSRSNGWYFVRIDDEWRPVEWVDSQFDASPMLCALILEVDENPISIAMHAENRQLRAKVAELEAQAAIGRRAVEIVCQALPVWDGDGIDPEKHHCELTLLNERHRARAEIFSRLRDAERAEPEPATVAVDAGALEDSQLLDDLELVAREYMTGFSVVYRNACDGEPGGFVAMRRRHRTEPAPTLREAARRLLAGGE